MKRFFKKDRRLKKTHLNSERRQWNLVICTADSNQSKPQKLTNPEDLQLKFFNEPIYFDNSIWNSLVINAIASIFTKDSTCTATGLLFSKALVLRY